ncbi:d10e6a2c-c094-45e7-a94e-a4c2604547d1 [Thermothielavioides terrestris]|uniref:D10e6a2c-c094-45e7-a94e-a4c2604547d1 n=1 Tax=Thermothielavioides terrestris TaxID=2587410 RepID=A0A446B8R7_9PEZI|nr:d10e6a2c-c094-45e7-a94e-a4c2604547d1 [Thermothielavioides terrestris]
MASNPRRTPVTRSVSRGLTVKTNVVLQRGATFHTPTTPPESPETTFRPPPLPRRSQTNLDDVIDAHRRRVALTLGDIDKTLAGLSKDDSVSSARKALRDETLPLPRGVLDHTLDSAMGKEQPAERRILRPRTRRPSRFHESDSGLGTSIASTREKEATVKEEVKTSAVTRSAAARATGSETFPGLSPRATSRICEHTLMPLLGNASFKDFHPLLLECPRKIQDKQIVCLRDLEKTLLLVAPERTKVAELYLDFCLTTIRCIQATVEYLSEREQTRPRDVPYSSGYFIDLVDQIRQYAQQLAEAKEKGKQDEMDVDPYGSPPRCISAGLINAVNSTDEIKLHGGININGRPAELVRVKKNGKMISMATGELVEKLEETADGPVRFKRSASQELEDEENIMRSMARRKKNASPEELAPKKCREPGCNKEFKRPCDLTKHEKTHTRPWKCPVPTCKYHEYGWPTEKEMDRHHNDKHASAPPMFECLYKPCPYKSKRESNCKQHMEKAHGWTYVRTKTNGKKSSSSVAANSTHATPQLQNLPTPSSEHSMGVATPADDCSGVYGNNLDFPAYLPNDAEFGMIPQEITLDYSPIDNPTPSTDSGMDHNSAYQDIATDLTLYEDIYSARVQLPTPPPLPSNIYNKDVTQYMPLTGAELCHPQPAQLSPIGQGNAMLFTPNSLAEVDEGFDERHEFAAIANAVNGGDFILFPNGGASKPMYNEPLFAATEIPGMATGHSQPSSQDLLNAFNVEWSSQDLSAYLPY